MDILQTLEYTSKISSIKTASYVSILIQLTSYNMYKNYKNYAFDAVSQLCTQEVLKVICFTNYKLQRELLPYIHGQ